MLVALFVIALALYVITFLAPVIQLFCFRHRYPAFFTHLPR